MSVGVEPIGSSLLDTQERVELILGQLDQLPTLPTVAARLLAVAGSNDSSARDLVRILEADPSLTARILRMIRCANVAVRVQGLTVGRAVTLLGFRAVRNAALSTQFFETLSAAGSNASATQRRRGLWNHSLAVACAAESIAERSGGISGEAFVCGLLHDIGKIALDVCLPKSYARVLDRSEERPVCVCDVEREVLGLDHVSAGKRLVTRWRLGREIVESVWLHHQHPDALPAGIAHAGAVRIVHVADALVRQAGIGESGSRHVTDIESAAVPLKLNQQAFAEIIAELPERMKPLQEALGLGETDDRSYFESLAEANRRLGRLNVELSESNQSMQLRSDCLEALSAFSARLSEHDRVADVCSAAAELFCTVLRLDRALVVGGASDSGCLHVGIVDAKQAAPSRAVLSREESADLSRESTQDEVMPAPESCDALWYRVLGSAHEAPLWLLRFERGAVGGGVLFSAEENTVRPFQSAATERRSLLDAVALAVSSAAARVQEEKTAEDLLDLNRRLHTAQKQLVRMRSISMIAQMAAGAAHELNNPLAVISGRAQMELNESEDADLRRGLEIIIEQAARASEIVSELMSFAKPDKPQPCLQSLAEVLESTCQHWQGVLGREAVRLNRCNDAASATVHCDADQLRDMLQAVFANAVEATSPDTRRIQINSPSRASDETVRIVVEDNGVGMTPELLEHALDPFFSSRPAGRGRGMGLSRAYRLAEINGGSLCLESKPQIGTRVTIELPARAPVS